MAKDKERDERKTRFEWAKHTPLEWCDEWINKGTKMTARVPKKDLCSLSSRMPECMRDNKGRIQKGQDYYVGRSWGYIAHASCADRYYAEHAAKKHGEELKEQERIRKEQDAAWKEQERLRRTKGIIPMPPTLTPVPSAPAVVPPAAPAAEVVNPSFSLNLNDYVELQRLRGFKEAVEMFLGAGAARNAVVNRAISADSDTD